MVAYLNGLYAYGKLSIFMEIQPGEYDTLLQWPFSHKIEFTLLDQSTDTAEVFFIYERDDTIFIIFKLKLYFELKILF